jgi:hypothetical protein
MEDVIKAIDNGMATFIGESQWFKDSAYQVYRIEDRYYSVIVCDNQSKWIMESSVEEIAEEDITKYI